jgi:hypothetical protein
LKRNEGVSIQSRPIKVPKTEPRDQCGQLNAVLAAFKAGITPARIARQFGLSQSDVRKALATDATKGETDH